MTSLSDKKISIVTGGGRCGTQFFGDHMGRIANDCFSVHEPDILHPHDPDWFEKLKTFGLYQLVIGKLLRRRGFRSLSIQADLGNLAADEIRRRIRKQRYRYFEAQEASCVVESNAAWWGISNHADVLSRNIRVAVIIRHPVSWIESWVKHGGLHDSRDLVSRFRLGRIHDDSWSDEPEIRLAHSWMRIYGRLDAQCARFDNHRIFRFEDIFHSTDTREFDELVRFVRHDDETAINWQVAHELRGIPHNASQKSGKSPSLDIGRIRDICAPLAQKHGYFR